MGAVDEAFTSLFYGAGSWLGLLLMSILLIAITIKWRKVSILIFPVSVLFALDYITNGLGWHALIMLFLSLFMIFEFITEVFNK